MEKIESKNPGFYLLTINIFYQEGKKQKDKNKNMSGTYVWGGDQRKQIKVEGFQGGGPSLYFRGLPPQNYLTLTLPLTLP